MIYLGVVIPSGNRASAGKRINKVLQNLVNTRLIGYVLLVRAFALEGSPSCYKTTE